MAEEHAQAGGEDMKTEAKIKVIDNGDIRRYYTMIPNMVDDMGLTVYAFRLYVHLKRVAGDDGKCWQSTRTLAEACNIGLMTVSKAKKELVEKKLITISTQKTEHGGYDSHVIAISDIWLNNSAKYQVPAEYLQVPHENLQVPTEILKNNPLIITVPIEENKFSSLAEEKYFRTFRRKRWANVEQERFFKQLVDKYGETELIRAIEWAALKNISDLSRIEKALITMQKNTKNENGKITSNKEDGSIYV